MNFLYLTFIYFTQNRIIFLSLVKIRTCKLKTTNLYLITIGFFIDEMHIQGKNNYNVYRVNDLLLYILFIYYFISIEDFCFIYFYLIIVLFLFEFFLTLGFIKGMYCNDNLKFKFI